MPKVWYILCELQIRFAVVFMLLLPCEYACSGKVYLSIRIIRPRSVTGIVVTCVVRILCVVCLPCESMSNIGSRSGLGTKLGHFLRFLMFTVETRFMFLFNNQSDALIIQIYSVIKLCMFRASSLTIIKSFLLYVQHWYISYSFEDNFQAGLGWPNLFGQEIPHVSGIPSAHHQEFSTVHSALVYFIQVWR